MIGRVLSGNIGSANILRQRKWEAQRANQPWGSGAATTYLSAISIFDKVREFN
tara:strand:+ start:800 stop:958 length:159 start_codon:yes stop_codon:yes gene_type:complete